MFCHGRGAGAGADLAADLGVRCVGARPAVVPCVLMIRGNISGWVAGLALAPAAGLLSAVRQSRMFHPAGVLCAGDVEPLAKAGGARELARRLAGPALLRWSSAWWKRGEWPDVLGCGLRFTRAPLGVEAGPDDQDLLLATIGRPWTLPWAPLVTRQHDFLGNLYYGVSPFEVAGLGRIEWRLRPERPAPAAATRAERLARAIDDGEALVVLEQAPYIGPLRRPKQPFEPLLAIRLTSVLALDQERLRFDPYRSGRGIEPVGLVHAMRRPAYFASQALRPSGARQATLEGSPSPEIGGGTRVG